MSDRKNMAAVCSSISLFMSALSKFCINNLNGQRLSIGAHILNQWTTAI